MTPPGRELQVAFILAKAKAACHPIVKMSRDGNTMLLAHRWFRGKGWRRLARVKLLPFAVKEPGVFGVMAPAKGA